MQRIARICALTALLAGCGGGSDGAPSENHPLQTYRNCLYRATSPGFGYFCSIVTQCDNTDVCKLLAFPDPSCQVGSTTCDACPVGQFSC